MHAQDYAAVSEALRTGKRVRDALFDEIYSDDIRRVSARFWTPVEVARTAARWLAAQDARAILDVGSGAGKFCIVASLAAGKRITGLEQRHILLDAARTASLAYGAQTDFRLGTLETLDPSEFDAFYLFNPFGENLYPTEERFDSTAELSTLRYSHDLSIFEHWLEQAKQGTLVVTYHGFGGSMPNTYRMLRALPKGTDQLRLWKKVKSGRSSEHAPERKPLVVPINTRR